MTSSVVERERAKRAADEEARRKAVLRRLQWAAPSGLSAPDLQRKLGWHVTPVPTLRELAERGEVHEREGVWFFGPAPAMPSATGQSPSSVRDPGGGAAASGVDADGARERAIDGAAPVDEGDESPGRAAAPEHQDAPPAAPDGETETRSSDRAPSIRDRLLALVTDQPGLSTTEIAARLGVDRTTVADLGRKLGLRSELGPRRGRTGRLPICWYPGSGTPPPAPAKPKAKARPVSKPTTARRERLLALVTERPGQTTAELAEALDCARTRVMQLADDVGLARGRRREGRAWHATWYPPGAEVPAALEEAPPPAPAVSPPPSLAPNGSETPASGGGHAQSLELDALRRALSHLLGAGEDADLVERVRSLQADVATLRQEQQRIAALVAHAGAPSDLPLDHRVAWVAGGASFARAA